MAQLSHSDKNNIAILANVLGGQAYTAHALSPGASESSVDAQHSKALSYWNGLLASGLLNPQETAAVNDAVAHLTARQAHLRNPVAVRGEAER